MTKCLITKLTGSSQNQNLLRLGEMRIRFNKVTKPTEATQCLGVSFIKPVQLEIIGDGYFTDKGLTANKGKKISVQDATGGVFVSNNDLYISIADKYNISVLQSAFVGQSLPLSGDNKSFNLESIKFSKSLRYLSFSNSPVNGDISALENLTALTNIYLSNTPVNGDISALKNLTKLTSITLDYSPVNGDISALKNLTALKTLTLGSPDGLLTGDITHLSNSKIKDLKIMYATLTGDLATLPTNCRHASFIHDLGSSFTWGNRDSSSTIIAIEGNVMVQNLDKMLQDQAKGQVGFTTGDAVYLKSISVKGSRTSASDDALAALQQKGYTVTITPA